MTVQRRIMSNLRMRETAYEQEEEILETSLHVSIYLHHFLEILFFYEIMINLLLNALSRMKETCRTEFFLFKKLMVRLPKGRYLILPRLHRTLVVTPAFFHRYL